MADSVSFRLSRPLACFTLRILRLPQSAVLYTIIESCRRRGINPYEYLRDVLTRLPSMNTSEISEITPEAWAKGRIQAPLANAA